MRVHVAPELNAYRFAAYTTGAGNYISTAAAISNGSGLLTAIDNAQAALDEDEVPQEGRILSSRRVSTTCSRARSLEASFSTLERVDWIATGAH